MCIFAALTFLGISWQLERDKASSTGADHYAHGILSRVEEQWGVSSIPLNFDSAKGGSETKVLKRARFMVDSARCDDLFKIAKSAVYDLSMSNQFEVIAMGGADNAYWSTQTRKGREIFLSVVASPRKGGVEICIFRRVY